MNKDRMDEIIADLQGTCRSISDFLVEGEEETQALCAAIDSEIFRCSVCDWWCELSEAAKCDLHGEEACSDCCEHTDEEE